MEIKLDNVKEKLANARKLCPGMSEEVYALTNYMSKVTSDTVDPYGMALCLMCVLSDVERERCGYAVHAKLPKYYIENKSLILSQAPYVLQVIDAIADEEFANEVRRLCKNVLKFDPPKRVKADVDSPEYPEYVKVAIDWWANAILAPKLDMGEELPAFLSIMAANTIKRYSEEEIRIFKVTLAEAIIEELKIHRICVLNVDYGPCDFFANAGEKIGVNGMMGWPWKTSMNVSEEQVTISAGYGAPWNVLWSKPKKK